jgi:hypothetical protein
LFNNKQQLSLKITKSIISGYENYRFKNNESK